MYRLQVLNTSEIMKPLVKQYLVYHAINRISYGDKSDKRRDTLLPILLSWFP